MSESKNPSNKPGEFKDERTREKINRHLSDESDTISEDDIKNVITDISSVEKDDNGNQNKEIDKNQLPTSWNIIE
ncbi:hypothetical protein BH20BAC1_BH20BAC1_19810 [soil metagenome]